MRTKSRLILSVAILALGAGTAVHAQTYSNAVQSLNPVGYWPLQESTPPPTPASLNITAHNSGTMGTVGDGLYGAWYQANGASWYVTNNVVLTNAQYTGDGSQALLCQSRYTTSVPGQYVVVPHATNGVANDALTIKLPFSVECWAYIGSTNSAARILVAQGTTRTDCGGSDPNNPFNGGTFQAMAGFELLQYQDYISFMTCATNGFAKPSLQTSSYNTWRGFKVGQLLHIVATIDEAGHKVIYTNGVLCVQNTSPANGAGLRFVPDPVSPIMIGSGPELPVSRAVPYEDPYSPYSGVLDEVAIYTNALTAEQALAHYQAAASGTYSATVLADFPMLYYRFDDSITPANAGYDTASFPTANNYGVEGANANGLYQPGTTPGVAGPSFAGFGVNSRAVALNGAFGTVNVGNGNLPSSLNPTGAVPLTVVSWFKGAPADSPNRFQEIVGHGDSSYRLALGWSGGKNTGTNVGTHFNPGPGPELQFANIADETTNGFALNDGLWHMVAGVSDGTNEYLYLDGRLAKSASNPGGISIVGATNDLVLGGDPQYTYAAVGTEYTIRNYNGSIAHVAFWTNALSSADISQLYGAAAVPPTIAVQPQSQAVDAGTSVTLSVAVRGSAPFTYQWYKGTSSILNATNSTLTFNPVAGSDAGIYHVVVSNSGGSATSDNATLTVYTAPVIVQQSPTSVQVFRGTSPTFYVTSFGSGVGYQWSFNSTPINGATGSSYTAANIQNSGTYTCLLTNYLGSTPISPIAVTVLTPPTAPYPSAVLGSQPSYYYRLDETSGTTAYDYAGGLNAVYTNSTLNQPGYTSQFTPSTDSDPAVMFGMTAGDVDKYAGRVSTYLNFATPAGNSRAFSVEAWVQPNGAQTTDAGLVTIGHGYGGEQFCLDMGGASGLHTYRFYVNNATNTSSFSVSSSDTTAASDNLWHHVVGVCDEPNGFVYLYVDGVLAGSHSIPANSGIKALTEPLAIGSRMFNSASTTYDNQFIGNIDEVSIYPVALSSNQVVSHYLAAGVPPHITQQPTAPSIGYFTNSLILNEGSTLQLDGAALGTGPLTYQWLDYSGTPIAGQTTASLVIPNISSTQSGYWYSLRASNPYGQADSLTVTLTIVAGPPYLIADISPLQDTVREGTPYSYTVEVGGTAPFQYQWYEGSSPIPNATNATYAFTAKAGTNTYYVHVSNSQSSVDSSVATLVGTVVPKLNPVAYGYRMKVQFTGYTNGESLLNFPALVKLSPALPGFGYSQFQLPNGSDLRFTDATGSNQIPHEIDEWNDTNGVSTVWVQVPGLTGTNDYVYAYWGNAAPEAAIDPTNVWSPAYSIVYHLKETGAPYLDSTLQYPADTTIAPVLGAGIVGLDEIFGNGSTYLSPGQVTLSNAFTVSAWVNIGATASSCQAVWANSDGGYATPGFRLYVNNWQTANGALVLECAGASGGTENDSPIGVVPAGSWHQVACAFDHDGANAKLYVDGVLQKSGTIKNDFPLDSTVTLGRMNNDSFTLHGGIDEARISNTTNSVNWLQASYQTVANNSGFQSYSGITAQRNLSFTVSGGNLVLTWSAGTLQSATSVNGTYTDVTTTSPYSAPLNEAAQKFFRVKIQ